MKKVFIFCLVVFLLFPCIFAEENRENKVVVFDFHYKDGKVTLKDKVIKYGFAPDRKIQPKEGYNLVVLDRDEKVIHSFVFEVPNKIFTDIESDGKVEGGVIIVNETDFSLVVPYYKEMERVVIYDENNKKIVDIKIKKENINLNEIVKIMIVIVLFYLFSYYFLRKRAKHKVYK